MSTSRSRLIVVLISSLPRLEPLADLLDSLERVQLPADYRLHVVVVDNGDVPSVPDDRPGVTVVHEPSPGIVPARNRSVEVALELQPWAFAIIDDDEVATPNWLRSMIATQIEFSADVVTGPVEFVLPVGVSRTATLERRFAKAVHPLGPYAGTVATNNVLILAHWFEGTDGLRFDPAFNGTGGEDVDLVRRLRARGAEVVWSPSSVVTEIVPPERASPLALRQRAMRNGQLEVRFRLQSGQSTATRQMVRAVYHGAKSSFRYAVVGLFIPRHREFGRLEVSRSLGYWKAAAGLRQFEEYRSADADSHGRVSVSAGEVGAARHRPAGD